PISAPSPLRPSATSLENSVLRAAERRSRELPPPLRGRVGEGGTKPEPARASTAASDLGPPSGLRPPPPQGGRTREAGLAAPKQPGISCPGGHSAPQQGGG